MMIPKKEFAIENKSIQIYDNIFDLGEMQKIHEFALSKDYRLSRLNSEISSHAGYPTLKCKLELSDLLKLNFFNKEILQLLAGRRLRDFYLILGTASDKYFYHTDSFYDNDLTVLYYINTSWSHEDNPGTEFLISNDETFSVKTVFKPGRLVVFNSTIAHKSVAPSPESAEQRFCLVLKFSDKDTPGFENCISVGDFVISPMVLTDKEEQCIKYLKKLALPIGHSGRSLYDHCLGVFRLLKTHTENSDLSLAGLFHSINGTSQFSTDHKITQEEFVDLIGHEGAKLASIFSKMSNRLETLMFEECPSLDRETRKNLLYIEYYNLIEQYPYTNADLGIILEIRNLLDRLEIYS